MKTLIRLFALLAIVGFVLVAQRKSDYATVQNFQNKVKTISKSVDEAKTVQDCAEVSASLDALEKEFSGDKALLDKVLYPEDYSKTFENLHGKLLIRQKDIGVIESQVVRITELEAKVRELSDEVTSLNAQNEKLMSDVNNLSQNIKKLSSGLVSMAAPLDSLRNLIVKLRQGLQERDALIFALSDSLFLQYDKNVAEMKDVEKQGLIGKMEQHGVIGNVKRSILDNMAFLETTQLKGSDLVSIIRQQQRFQSQWKGLGSKLASLYLTGKHKKDEVAVVDTMLSLWGEKVDNTMWRSLTALFKEKGFVVREFKNGEEFNASIAAFLEEQIQNPKDEAMETRFKLFNNFDESLWKAELSPTWLPALIECGKITDVQKKDIEQKVEQWRSAVSPGISVLTYVLILLAIIIIIMVVMRFFRKSPNPASPK